MAEIRANRVKHKLQEGKCATVLGGLNNPEVVDFMGQFGFDAMWIETEHGAVGWDQLAHMSRACDLWGMTPICRVNSNEPWLITRTLDVGAMGIVVPHVNTKEDAEVAAKSAKYGPLGNRGMFNGRQSFGVADYYRKANEETLVVVLIEEIQAINALPEILSADNIDVFFLAPSDLAQTMGYTGQMDHPEVLSVIDRSINMITEAGKTVGTLVNDENVEAYIEKGVRFFLNNWQPWIASGASQYLSKLAAKER